MLLLDKLIPGFQEKAHASIDINSLCAPVCLPSHSLNFITNISYLDIELQSGANDARSDDTSRLKVAIADWLNCREPHNVAGNFDTRLSAKRKEERGISNDVTGRLLCPIDYDWDDPE